MDYTPKKNIKQIRDKSGSLYFNRNSYINTKWFSVMEHEFFQNESDFIFDKDGPLHNHPKEFWSLIVNGGYNEVYIDEAKPYAEVKSIVRKVGDFGFVDSKRFHKIKGLLRSETKDGKIYCRSLCIGPRDMGRWGYFIDRGSWFEIVSNEEFRKNKSKYIVEV